MREFDTLVIVTVPCPQKNGSDHYRIVGELSKGGKAKEIMSILEKNKLSTDGLFIPTNNIYAKSIAENIRPPKDNHLNFMEIEELEDDYPKINDASLLISRKLNDFINPKSEERSWATTIIAGIGMARKIIDALSSTPENVQPYEIFVFQRSDNSVKKIVAEPLF